MRTGFVCPFCPQEMLTDPPEIDGLLRCERCKLQGPASVMKQLAELRALTSYSNELMRNRRERITELDQELSTCGAPTCVVQTGTDESREECTCSIVNILGGLRIRSEQLGVAMGTVPVAQARDDASH